MRSRRILFITWDGPQTQYLGRLFLPVFEHLASAGYRITIVQFSSAGPELRRRIQSQCVESGVQYVSVPIIKRLGIFGVILALVRGSAWLTLRLTQRAFDIVIVRSIVPALVFLVTQGKRRVPLVYDSDGLPIEQRLEFEGVQERGLLHRFFALGRAVDPPPCDRCGEPVPFRKLCLAEQSARRDRAKAISPAQQWCWPNISGRRR